MGNTHCGQERNHETCQSYPDITLNQGPTECVSVCRATQFFTFRLKVQQFIAVSKGRRTYCTDCLNYRSAVGKSPHSISVTADNEALYSLEPKFQHLNHKSTQQDPVLSEFNTTCIYAGWFGAVIALLSSQYPIYDTKVLEGVLDFINHFAFIRTLSIQSDDYDNHNTKYLHCEPVSTSLNQSVSLFVVSHFLILRICN